MTPTLLIEGDLRPTHGWMYLVGTNRALHFPHKTILKRYKPRPDLKAIDPSKINNSEKTKLL